MAVFRIFLSNAFYGFSCFVKEVALCSRTNTVRVIPRHLLYSLLPRRLFRGMHDKPSLFTSRCQPISVDHRVSIARLRVVSSFRRGNNIALTRSVHVVVKCGYHCAYTNENSHSGNQKGTSKCYVSFNQKSTTIILACIFYYSHIAIGLWSRKTFLDYDEFWTNEGMRKIKNE